MRVRWRWRRDPESGGAPSFPNSISGVVYQNGAFSCVNDSNWYAPVADSAKRAATDALNGWDLRRCSVLFQCVQNLGQVYALPTGDQGDRQS